MQNSFLINRLFIVSHDSTRNGFSSLFVCGEKLFMSDNAGTEVNGDNVVVVVVVRNVRSSITCSSILDQASVLSLPSRPQPPTSLRRKKSVR